MLSSPRFVEQSVTFCVMKTKIKQQQQQKIKQGQPCKSLINTVCLYDLIKLSK